MPELVQAMEQLDQEKFAKLMAYLNNPLIQRVRTNNHVERTNRMFRFLEKVRYKWRRRQDAGAVPGFEAGRDLERLGAAEGQRDQATEFGQTLRNANPSQTEITTCRLTIWWRSARSVRKTQAIRGTGIWQFRLPHLA